MKSNKAGSKGVRVQGDEKGAFRETLFKGYYIERSRRAFLISDICVEIIG